MSLPYTSLVPLLITDLLSCIFAIEDGNVILRTVGLFCMLYKACNIGLRWAGCESTKIFPVWTALLSSRGNAVSPVEDWWSHVETIAYFLWFPCPLPNGRIIAQLSSKKLCQQWGLCYFSLMGNTQSLLLPCLKLGSGLWFSNKLDAPFSLYPVTKPGPKCFAIPGVLFSWGLAASTELPFSQPRPIVWAAGPPQLMNWRLLSPGIPPCPLS